MVASVKKTLVQSNGTSLNENIYKHVENYIKVFIDLKPHCLQNPLNVVCF